MTNKKASIRSECQVRGDGIAKDPFALVRYSPEVGDVLLLIRDPRLVVTSDTHPNWPGKYVIGWKKDEGKAPYGLERHWKALQPYRQAFTVRYEDLIHHPNETQERIGAKFGLHYSRKFSDWPYGQEHISKYWIKRGGLGEIRALENGRQPDPERLRQQEEHDGFREMCQELGYLSS